MVSTYLIADWDVPVEERAGLFVLVNLLILHNKRNGQPSHTLVNRKCIADAQVAADDSGVHAPVLLAQEVVQPRDQHGSAQEVQRPYLVREGDLVGNNRSIKNDVEGRFVPGRVAGLRRLRAG